MVHAARRPSVQHARARGTALLARDTDHCRDRLQTTLLTSRDRILLKLPGAQPFYRQSMPTSSTTMQRPSTRSISVYCCRDRVARVHQSCQLYAKAKEKTQRQSMSECMHPTSFSWRLPRLRHSITPRKPRVHARLCVIQRAPFRHASERHVLHIHTVWC